MNKNTKLEEMRMNQLFLVFNIIKINILHFYASNLLKRKMSLGDQCNEGKKMLSKAWDFFKKILFGLSDYPRKWTSV